MRYLSEEWVAAQWEEAPIEIDNLDRTCGSWDGPCGGCDSCIAAQFSFSLMKERDRANVFLRAGFDVSDPILIRVDWAPGYGGSHDAYGCWCSKERPTMSFPWKTSDDV